MIVLALIFSLLIPVPAHAQFAGAAQADFSYQRSMARMIGGTASGLQMSSNSTMDILNGGRKVGSIALKEKRLMDLAMLAGRAASIPGMIALGATVLLDYGLQKCADGTWCKPAQGEQAPNGVPYPASEFAGVGLSNNTTFFGDAVTVCKALIADGNTNHIGVNTSYAGIATYASTYGCKRTRADNGVTFESALQRYTQGVCYGGATLQNGQCVPPGYTPGTQPTPATADEINQAWQRAMQANPFLQQQTWGFEDPTQQNEDWAKALAQLAEVIGTGTVQDVGPTVSSTAADGKVTKKQTTCTYTGTPNSNMAAAKDQPLSVSQRCTTTTTNPDGTTSTETTETSPAAAGDKAPVKVDVETCGLPGKPACKIDETGTKTDGDVVQAEKVATTALDQMKTDNGTILDSKMSDIDQKARDASAHWISLFNKLPTYGSEVCTPPTIHDSAANQDLTFDICPHYYMAKDVFAVFIALGFLVSLAFDVRDAIKT